MYLGDGLIYCIEDIGCDVVTEVYAMELGGERGMQWMNNNLHFLLVRHLVSIADAFVLCMERLPEVGTSARVQLRSEGSPMIGDGRPERYSERVTSEVGLAGSSVCKTDASRGGTV